MSKFYLPGTYYQYHRCAKIVPFIDLIGRVASMYQNNEQLANNNYYYLTVHMCLISVSVNVNNNKSLFLECFNLFLFVFFHIKWIFINTSLNINLDLSGFQFVIIWRTLQRHHETTRFNAQKTGVPEETPVKAALRPDQVHTQAGDPQEAIRDRVLHHSHLSGSPCRLLLLPAVRGHADGWAGGKNRHGYHQPQQELHCRGVVLNKKQSRLLTPAT